MATTNSEFINNLYQHVLLRKGDAAGINYYTSRLDQGLATRAQVVESFLDGAEIRQSPTALANIYQATLGRQPDISGLQFWAGVFQAGATLSQIAGQMVTSIEFTTKYASLSTPAATINQIYMNALGRNADTAGLAYWQSELNKGASLGAVAASIALSAESAKRNDMNMKKTLLWHALLDSEPTAANLASLPNTHSALAVSIVQQNPISQVQGPFAEFKNTLYANTDITGLIKLDLVKNQLSMNGTPQNLTLGTLANAVNADLSALNLPSTTKIDTKTTPQLVRFIGDDAINIYVASDYGDAIQAGKGNDKITLGKGTDVVIFADSAINNGIDEITDFTLATDLLNFGAYLNNTTQTTTMVSASVTEPLLRTWNNGDVLVVQGNALDTPTAIAQLFNTAKVFAAPKTASKSVMMTSDVAGDTKIWFITNQLQVNTITADEVQQVGVLKNVNNILSQKTLDSLLASTKVMAVDSLTGGVKTKFEASAVTNGISQISNFKLGAEGDILDFSAFLNKTGTTKIATKLSTSTTATAWANGDVLVVQGDSIDTSAEIAALFGTGKPFAAPTGQAKAVIIVSDIIGDATAWYITNKTTATITSIEENEVEQVAVLTGINNLALVGLSVDNFA